VTAPYRILITGSRAWPDADVIRTALDKAGWAHGWNLTVVHGAASEGANAMAAAWCRELADRGVTAEPHPADWRPGGIYNRAAGMTRNRQMVALGADECMAFIAPCSLPSCTKRGPHGSHGATYCAAVAEAAGIAVSRWAP